MKTPFILFLTLVLSSFVSPIFAKEPQNLEVIRTKLVKYHDSGEYQNDQAKVINQAMLYLKNRIANNAKSHKSVKMAIVMDIDETSLSNYDDMVRLRFGGTLEEIKQDEDKANDPAIKSSLELYRYAKKNNIAVFFISGRKENSRAPTTKNLNDAGYVNFDGLILRPENYSEKSIVPFKTSARTSVEKQGYTIVLNLGDQESDMKGNHADKSFKLPNPYYFIP